MNTVESPPRGYAWARIMIALAYLAGISLIVGWSLSEGSAADRPVAVAGRLPNPAPAVPLPPPLTLAAEVSGVRSKVNCVGCGVVESVRRIDTPIAIIGECRSAVGPGIPGRLIDMGGPYDPDSLANTVASVIADGRGRKKIAVDTRHQIVVRFRDGSRQVLDEATPRSLRVGDRIVVISGTVEANGAAGARAAANGEPWRSVRSRTDG